MPLNQALEESHKICTNTSRGIPFCLPTFDVWNWCDMQPVVAVVCYVLHVFSVCFESNTNAMRGFYSLMFEGNHLKSPCPSKNGVVTQHHGVGRFSKGQKTPNRSASRYLKGEVGLSSGLCTMTVVKPRIETICTWGCLLLTLPGVSLPAKNGGALPKMMGSWTHF